MKVEDRHLFADGQFRRGIMLTPDRLPLSYRIIAALVAIVLFSLFAFLLKAEGDYLKVIIACPCFGVIGLALAFGKASYQVIQGYQIRMIFSLGPLSFPLKKIALSSDIPFGIEQNSSDEIMLIANYETSDQLSIGPFQSKEQAEQTFAKFQFIHLDSAALEENRIARAKQEIAALTSDIRPAIPRVLQVTLIALFLLAGMSRDSPNMPLISAILIIAGILVSEWFIISTTVVESVASDYSKVTFSVRSRFFWKNLWTMNPSQPDSVLFLKQTLNSSAITTAIIGFVAISLLYTKRDSSPEEAQTSRVQKITVEDEEAARRGRDLLKLASEAREQKKKADLKEK